MRKLRKNPNLFLNELSKIEWESLANMNDINDMEEFWTSQINKCLNILAPVKTRKVKQKMFCLPKDVQAAIHRKKHLQKQHQSMVQIGKADLDLEREFKKQKNYCNKLIKKAVREKNCQNVTSDSRGCCKKKWTRTFVHSDSKNHFFGISTNFPKTRHKKLSNAL